MPSIALTEDLSMKPVNLSEVERNGAHQSVRRHK